MKEELLEVLAAHAGCQYLSICICLGLLCRWRMCCRLCLRSASASGSADDAVQYIAGVSRSFSSKEEAKAFLSDFCRSLAREGLR